MELKSQQPLSSKLVSFFQSKNRAGGNVYDDIIRILRGGEGKGCLRLYLSISSLGDHSLLPYSPSYEVNVIKIQSSVKSLYADRLFDCSDTTLPLVKVNFDFNCTRNSNGGKPLPVSHLLIREIAKKGFVFLNQQYHFLAFKDLGTEFAYFYPQSDSSCYHNSFNLWQSVGNFCSLPHVPAVGLRLGLLVSGACVGFPRGVEEGITIRVAEDVYIASGSKEEVATGIIHFSMGS